MKRKLKPIPGFASEDEEREFWEVHDTTDYFDSSKMIKATFPNLKPSARTISIRLPESLIEQLKILANKQDIPYQSLVKIYLSEKVKEAFR
jgi:predicted DNA binding CopG/RHH family protein